MNIVIGISGGIAAYKSPYLVRLLCDAGHIVQCVATTNALEFVTRTTLETVSGRKLYCNLFAPDNAHSTEHIALKDWCEAVIVAPATANIIGKMANGIADDALSTLLLAVGNKPIFVCPAMNSEMWNNIAVQRNIETLIAQGVHIIGPENGHLACGAVGSGRMTQPDTIIRTFNATLLSSQARPLSGKRVLITAGPTYERIDPVRFIGNYSSGKMGVALAEALAEIGATVELVAGPIQIHSSMSGINTHNVESAQEMYTIATQLFPKCDAAILAAAVADYRPDHYINSKIKRQDNDEITLRLVRNPDILATLGQQKKEHQTLIGFALETDNEEQHAEDKLKRKNLDYIILNSLRDKGAGFGVDTNKVTLIHRDGTTHKIPLMSKRDIARQIVAHCLINHTT